MKARLLTLGAFVLLLGTSQDTEPKPVSERHPSLRRWVPHTRIYGTTLGHDSSGRLTIADKYVLLGMAVDSREVVHVLGRVPDPSSSGIGLLVYQNSSYATRQANGFSAPVVLAQIPMSLFHPADIAVDGSDVVHVIWSEGAFVFRKLLGETGWGSPEQISPDPVVDQVPYKYDLISLNTSRQGEVKGLLQVTDETWPAGYHSWFPVQGDPTEDPNAFLPSYGHAVLGAASPFRVDLDWYDNQTQYPNDHPLSNVRRVPAPPDGSLASIGPTNLDFILRPDGSMDMLFIEARLGPQGPGFTFPILIIPPHRRYGFPYGRDVYDSKGNLYGVSREGGQNGFLFGINEQPGPNIPVGPLAPNIPAVATPLVIDSRDRLHLLYIGESDRFRYATQIGNPDPAKLDWHSGDAGIGAGSDSAALHMSRNDEIHVETPGGYARSSEFGIGARDPRARLPVFPGGSVNVTSGNLMASVPLFSTAGLAPTQAVELVYNSLDNRSGLVGAGWRLNYEIYIEDHWSYPWGAPTATLFLADGRPIHFSGRLSSGAMVADEEFGFFGILERVEQASLATEYRLTHQNGDIWMFNTAGKLREIRQPDGNYLTLVYGPTGLLTNIVDQNGLRSTRLDYETGKLMPRVTKITDKASGVYSLDYAGGHLKEIKFESGPGAPTYSFDYWPSNDPAQGARYKRLKTFRTPRGTDGEYGWTCRYEPDGRLARVDDPDDVFINEFESDGSAPQLRSSFVSLAYDNEIDAANPTGRAEVTFRDRRGQRSRFVVDPRLFLVKEVSDPTVLAKEKGLVPEAYEHLRGQVSSMRDRWGKTTRFTYVSDSAGVGILLEKVFAPHPSGVGEQEVAAYTYTDDGFNQIKTATSLATPAEGSAALPRTTTYVYNEKRQLTDILLPKVTRPDGRVQENVSVGYRYTPGRGALETSTDETRNETKVLTFHAVHCLPTSIQRPDATQLEEFKYDDLGNLLEHTRPQGNIQRNEATRPTVYKRDGLYRVQSIKDPALKLTGLDYDLDSNPTGTRPPAGAPTTVRFDRRGVAVEGSGPDGTWNAWPDAEGNIRRVRDVRGAMSHVSFDSVGRPLVSKTQGGSLLPGGQGADTQLTHTVQYAYELLDESGRRSSTQTIGSRTARTQFDFRGRPTLTIGPNGITQRRTTFDEQDQVVATEFLSGGAVLSCEVYFRDARDRVHRVKRQERAYGAEVPPNPNPPPPESNTYTLFNEAGFVEKIVSPLGTPTGTAHSTTFIPDARQRVRQVRDGNGQIVREFEYGDDDLVTEVKWPDPTRRGSSGLVTLAKYFYSARKELLRVEDGGSNPMVYEYGTLPNQVATATDALGRITETLYDPTTQRPKEVIEAKNTAAKNHIHYNWQNGLLRGITVWNPEASDYTATYGMDYDRAGRLERRTYPAVATGTQMEAERHFFNSYGELRAFKAGTKQIEHFYTDMGLPWKSNWTGPRKAELTRGFNAALLPETISEGRLSRTTSYELWKGTRDREDFRVDNAAWTSHFHSTDAALNFTSFGDGQGNSHAWQVDANNRPEVIRHQGKDVVKLTYTTGGLVDVETLYDANGQELAWTTHEYDALGRRKQTRTVKNGKREVLKDLEWDYNELHLVRRIDYHHLGVYGEFEYDGRRQLVSETYAGNEEGQAPPPFTQPWGGQATGNISHQSEAGEAEGAAVTAVNSYSASYQYHPNGIRKFQSINGVMTTLKSNALGQLVRQDTPGVGWTTHEYDAWGNEVRRLTQAGVEELYGYNYQNLLESYTNSATGAKVRYSYWPTGERYSKLDEVTGLEEIYLQRFGDVSTEYLRSLGAEPAWKNTYVQGSGLDQKRTRVPAVGGRRHYLGDQVGTVGTTLEDNGTVAERTVRDAFGNLIGGASIERYGFAQREHDAESGLVHMRARQYDPRTGRFTQTDPFRAGRASEHYAYAFNNPISFVDPMGMWGEGTEFGFEWLWEDIKAMFGFETSPGYGGGMGPGRMRAAFEAGVARPIYTATEIQVSLAGGALMAGWKGFGGALARNAVLGTGLAATEGAYRWAAYGKAPTPEGFALEAGVYTGVGLGAEGLVFVGGKVYAIFARGKQSTPAVFEVNTANLPDTGKSLAIPEGWASAAEYTKAYQVAWAKAATAEGPEILMNKLLSTANGDIAKQILRDKRVFAAAGFLDDGVMRIAYGYSYGEIPAEWLRNAAGKSGGFQVPWVKDHAERQLVRWMLTPQGRPLLWIGASKDICPPCFSVLGEAGIPASTPFQVLSRPKKGVRIHSSLERFWFDETPK